MKFKLAFLIIVCVSSQIAFAQTLTVAGVVNDAKTNQPVPFATLGIKGKGIGTVANENGIFSFKIDPSAISADEQLVISSIGYKPGNISVEKLKQGKQTINLTPLDALLQTVTVKPEKYKTKVFGRTGANTIMTANMFTESNLISDNLGREQASIFSIDKHSFIKDFNMWVTFNRFESVKFRLNFYSVKNGLPDQLIVDKDILFDVTKKLGWVKVDLTSYNIYLEGYKEIAVAIQWIKSVKTDTAARSAFGVSVFPTPFHSVFFRKKSQANWEKISPAHVAFNITANSYKPNKEKEEDAAIEEKESITDSLKEMLAYSKYAAEAAASGYGNSSKTGKYLHLPDGELYYETYGSGTPLLLLHGNGSSLAAFYQQIPVLAKSYQVIAVDTRAQGKSTDKTSAPFTYEKFAADMKILLDELQIKKTALLGWSDGGNTALIMASKYPELVSKVVTVGAVRSPDGVETKLLNKFQADFEREKTKTEPNNNGQRLLKLLLTEPHITESDLKQITVPVLVIAGEKDIVKPAHTQQIANQIKNGKLLVVKDAGHYVPQEKPVLFNKAVLDFLHQ
ncbi:alpha/beta fold hydrolase [Pedobacter duraquae]|uniref:Pimeloyl-ACP methyl ester carboxylesterase n=1 Tax=Pedobacter duraquae TaxID=425511 RepID=A0A4R6IQ84_9SPHI|nr:alpha/beta fold hydrolase [Pedobacter duraquae]TDO24490.1 pimeloyl-ACP methyl ester carboxylesterase [Pedobacter duraquae]